MKKKHKSPKRMDKAQLSKIVELYYNGMIPYQIAKHLAIPNGVVLYHLARLKSLKPAPRQLSLEDFIDLPEAPQCASRSYIEEIRKLREEKQRLLDIVAESLMH